MVKQQAQILKHSIGAHGVDIVTWRLTLRRPVLAEFNTHRLFARNAGSSRAIPIQRVIEQVKRDPALPVHWGKNKAGMQADEELTGVDRHRAEALWLEARDEMVTKALQLNQLGIEGRDNKPYGLHKQLTNRLLEPWVWVNVIMTTTDMQNFVKLRAHAAAQPEFRVLAEEMKRAYEASVPEQLPIGGWHIPFLQSTEADLPLRHRLKIATARAARESYHRSLEILPYKEDEERHDGLAASGHWSPFEHSAVCLPHVILSGPHIGWTAYRKFFPNESGRDRFNFCGGCGGLLDNVTHMHRWAGCLPDIAGIESYLMPEASSSGRIMPEHWGR